MDNRNKEQRIGCMHQMRFLDVFWLSAGSSGTGATGVHSRRTPGRRLPLFIPPWCRSINITHTDTHTQLRKSIRSPGWSVRLISFALKTE